MIIVLIQAHIKKNKTIQKRVFSSSSISTLTMLLRSNLLSYLLPLILAFNVLVVLTKALDCSTYTSSVTLSTGALLEFVSTETDMSVRITYDKSTWIGFAASDNGKMTGADAVIGNPNGVKIYSLTKDDYSDNLGAARQTLQNTKFTRNSDGSSVLEFTKLLNDGTANKVISPTGTQTFIYAMGDDDILSNSHQKKNSGKLTITLSPCIDDTGGTGGAGGGTGGTGETGGGTGGTGTGNGTGNIIEVEATYDGQVVFLIHGICAIIAFAFCMPVAATSAMAKKVLNFDLCNKKAWFVIHYYMNVLAFVLSIVMFGLAVYAVDKGGDDHFENTHEWLGLLTMILVFAQVAFAFVRPSPPSPPKPVVENEDNESGIEEPKQEKRHEEKTLLRSIWEISHRASALVILALGLYQIISGLNLYEDHYEGLNTWAFWTVAGCLYVIMVAFVVYAKFIAE